VDPVDYELVGGPFDGAVIRLGSRLFEMPPESLVLTPDPDATRTETKFLYELRLLIDRDAEGNTISEYLAYKHSERIRG